MRLNSLTFPGYIPEKTLPFEKAPLEKLCSFFKPPKSILKIFFRTGSEFEEEIREFCISHREMKTNCLRALKF